MMPEAKKNMFKIIAISGEGGSHDPNCDNYRILFSTLKPSLIKEIYKKIVSTSLTDRNSIYLNLILILCLFRCEEF